MRILVAGSAGFLGYHLCDRLLNDGHDVVGLDNYLTGQEPNTADLLKRPKFQFIQADLTQLVTPEAAEEAGLSLSGGRFAQVYNFACPASPIDFRTLGLAIMDVCSLGTRAALEVARRHEAVFLQASTSECYGNPKVHPQPEDYFGNVNPIGPRAVYDEGKRFAEALTMQYRREFGLETRIVRIFNTYGPRMRANDGRALPTFISQALQGEPVTIHGTGAQTRSFCYCTDLIDGIVRLANSQEPLPTNVGNPSEITIKDVAEEVIALCEKITGQRSRLTFVERMSDDPDLRRPDITKAKKVLGWEPVVSRSEGLARTVEWFHSLNRKHGVGGNNG